MAFNPNDHMMSLKGRDYLQVMWRLVWFREEHPDWTIDTKLEEHAEDSAVFSARICDQTGRQISSGYGSESKRDFGDYLEKAETKAVGRALAMLGYGTQFAPELDEGERIVDSPVQRTSAPAPVQNPVQAPAANYTVKPKFVDARTLCVCDACGSRIDPFTNKKGERTGGRALGEQ